MKTSDEIKLRLKAPMVVAERIAKGRYVPKVFGKAVLSELKKIQKAAKKLDGKSKKIF